MSADLFKVQSKAKDSNFNMDVVLFEEEETKNLTFYYYLRLFRVVIFSVDSNDNIK